MKRLLLILILIVSYIALPCCSTRYLKEPFANFTQSTKSISKNTSYCLDEFFDAEVQLRIVESLEEVAMQPSFLEPHTLTWTQLKQRQQLTNYIVTYATLLQAIVSTDNQKEIISNAKRIKTSLDNINMHSQEFLAQKEVALLSILSSGLNEAMTQSSRRSFLINIMSRNQPLLETITQRLESELKSMRIMIDNFYDRRFLLGVTLCWPESVAKREKYAKLGSKILEKKREVGSLLAELAQAAPTIGPCHRQLLDWVRADKSPLQALAQLSGYSSRLEEMYQQIARQKKK